MPLDRADAIVIGAGVEGLSAALTLALAGKQVACIDRRASVDELGGWDEAWAAPGALKALGLFQHGVRLCTPNPHLALNGGGWRVLWPDAARSARALDGTQSDAFLEFAFALQRWRAAFREPGAAARAMLGSLDLVRHNGGETAALGHVLRGSAASILDRSLGDEPLKGMILAMAARQAPAVPVAAGSAAILLMIAQFFGGVDQGVGQVAGGARALTAALAAAFKSAGGELALGHEVSEILMEREAAMGVALGPNTTMKAPAVIAAVAPKRLTQGLLSTRRYGRLLSGLRAAPRRAMAAMRIALAREPDLPEAHLGLWRSGVSIWLNATTVNLTDAARAHQERRIHETPAVELRFAPGLREAVVVSPYCPGELADGPWTPDRRDALRGALLAAIRNQWPPCHALIEEAELLKPSAPEQSFATGAIFGGAERGPALDAMFATPGDAPGSLLKGVYLCVSRPLEPDGQAGMLAAGAAAGLGGQRLRA